MASSSPKNKSGPKKTAPNQSNTLLVLDNRGDVSLFRHKQWEHDSLPSMGTTIKLRWFAAAFIPGQNVIVAAAGGHEFAHFSFVKIFSLDTMTWRDGPAMPTSREFTAGVCLEDGNTFMVCGGFCEQFLSCCELFDGKAWTTAGNLSTARAAHAMVLYRGQPVALGGCNMDAFLETTEQYDLITDTWTPFPPFTTPRSHFGAAVVFDKIYITGGWHDDASIASVEVYDGNAWSTLPTELLSGPRAEHTAFNFQDKLVVFGGKVDGGKVDVYDPITCSWSDNEIPEGYCGECIAVVF